MGKFKYKNIKKRKLYFICILVLVECFYIIIIIGNNITPKLIQIVKNNIKMYSNTIINDYVDIKILSDKKIDSIVNLITNNNGEIIGVDYNMNDAYSLMGVISENINNGLKNYNEYDSYSKYIDNNLILEYPIGLASNNIFLNNLGFKVPIKVIINKNVLCGLLTKVNNYGINNVVVSIYLKVNVYSSIISTQVELIDNYYEILLDSSVVMGNVPNYLNGFIESSGPVVSK